MENARNGDEANGGREEKKKRFRTPDVAVVPPRSGRHDPRSH
jgi:hypothetical protein